MNVENKLKKRFDEVELVISDNPLDWREKLMDLGFEYFEEDDVEVEEENRARVENQRQSYLVNYFEGIQPPDFTTLHTFLSEKESEIPNFPLIRRYFKKGNKQLKKLLIFGLKHNPTNVSLLNDLSFYNEFCLNLAELVAYYKLALISETDIENFKSLVSDFSAAVSHHHYEPFHALLLDDAINETKKIIVKQLQQKEKSYKKPIRF